MPKSKPKTTADSKVNIKTSSDFMSYVSVGVPMKTSSDTSQARLKTIRARTKLLDQVAQFVEDNYNVITWNSYTDPKGKKINFSKRVVKTYLDDARTANALMELQTNQEILDELNFAASKLVIGTDEVCGDGKCHILFVNVGIGDCTLISSPKGVRILIDLGSDSMQDVLIGPSVDPETDSTFNATVKKKILDQLQSKLFLNGNTMIPFLILTHTDSDHHNKLSWICNICRFGRVYYSGDKIGAYGTSTGGIRNAARADTNIKQVNLCQQKDGTVTRTIPGQVLDKTIRKAPSNSLFDKEYIDPVTGQIVLYHEQETDFRLSILAGNVTGVNVSPELPWVSDDADIKTAPQDAKQKLNGTLANKRSLVVLVEYAGKKVIVTGDATAVTEYFLVQQYAGLGLLNGLSVYRLPHHGSRTSSSYRITSALTKLDTAVASTSGKFAKLHGLPKIEILSMYPVLDGGDTDKHNIYAFSGDELYTKDLISNITHRVYATGSNDTRKASFAAS